MLALAVSGCAAPKEHIVKIEFVRSGGFAGPATEVKGAVEFDDQGGAHVTEGGSGYSRRMEKAEARKLRDHAERLLAQPKSTGSGAARDAYQFDLKLTSSAGKTSNVTLSGPPADGSIEDWLHEEADKIWQFRVSAAQ